jgi:shikimate kinase
MGVGKSTVGAALADHLGLGFVDLDGLLEAEAGCSVADLFDREGEPGFRLRETRAVRRLAGGPPVVLALGGGTIHHGDNLELLRGRFFVMSLLAPLSEIRARVGSSDASRPLWGDAESRFLERDAGYRRADACVDVSGLDLDATVRAVIEALPCD